MQWRYFLLAGCVFTAAGSHPGNCCSRQFVVQCVWVVMMMGRVAVFVGGLENSSSCQRVAAVGPTMLLATFSGF